MSVNFEELNKVVLATETLPLGGFCMDSVSCGTAGCMIGNYNALTNRWPFTFGCANLETNMNADDWKQFGLSSLEYFWLFGSGVYVGRPREYLSTSWEFGGKYLDDVTITQALSRLRKFIAYKRRKHELIHDEKYGVSQRSRTAEGNQLFAVLAVQDALVEMSLATAN